MTRPGDPSEQRQRWAAESERVRAEVREWCARLDEARRQKETQR